MNYNHLLNIIEIIKFVLLEKINNLIFHNLKKKKS